MLTLGQSGDGITAGKFPTGDMVSSSLYQFSIPSISAVFASAPPDDGYFFILGFRNFRFNHLSVLLRAESYLIFDSVGLRNHLHP